MRTQFILDDDKIEPFPYITTNTGFMKFFREIFISGRFPYYSEYLEKGKATYFERFQFMEEYGYFLPCMEVVDYIKNSNLKWLSVGCGRGYFEHILQLHGVDVIATDKCNVSENMYFNGGIHRKFSYTELEKINASDAIIKYSDRSVIFSWVSYDEAWGHEALCKIRSGINVLNIGEDLGGCTGDDSFNLHLTNKCELIEELPHYTFPCIYDNVKLYKVV